MKKNICGYEAVERGLQAGGVERLVCHMTGEPLHNAEKAICEGSFFASTHHKTAIIIYEKDAEALSYLNERHEKQLAGFEIIILGRELSAELLENMVDFNVMLMVAESVKDILKMTADAVAYSELKESPVAVYIPVRLLRSRKEVIIDGRYYCDDTGKIDDDERKARTTLLNKRYNRIFDVSHSNANFFKKSGRNDDNAPGEATLIIAISGCAGVVNEIAAIYKNVYMCKLDMPFADMSAKLSEVFRHFIIIGYGTAFIKEMLAQNKIIPDTTDCIELSGDKMHEICEIYENLSRLLPTSFIKNISVKDTGRAWDVDDSVCISESIDAMERSFRSARTSKQMQELITDMMCAKCPYRTEIRSVLAELPGKSVYEDIYCEKRGTMVRSGMSNAPSAYAAGLMITNRKELSLMGSDVRYLDCGCM